MQSVLHFFPSRALCSPTPGLRPLAVPYPMRRPAFYLLLLIALVFFPQSVRGQKTPWSEPHAFEPRGWFPAIATDSTGRVHLFWSQSIYYGLDPDNPEIEPSSGYDVVYYTSSPEGEKWNSVNDILAIPQYAVRSVEVTRPNPWISPAGILHLTFRNLDVFYSQAPVREAANAQAWRLPVKLNLRNLGYFSAITGDSRGYLHALYTENYPDSFCNLCYRLYYRQSQDDGTTWSIPADLSALAPQPVGAAKPQFLFDEEENIHVVWESGTGGTFGGVNDPVQILHAASYDGGATWPVLQQITLPDQQNARNPALGLDADNHLILAWLNTDEDRAYYRSSVTHGRSWEAPAVIPEVWGERTVHNTRQSAFSMVRDSAGILHLVMIGRLDPQQSSLSVLHLTWDGKAWSRPEIIAAYQEEVPEWPQAAIGLGNQLHVTWFVRSKDHVWDANPDYYTVFYSRRTLDAPSLEAIPLPTPTPTPTITPTPTATPRPTPPPSLGLQPIEPGQTHTIFSENDDLKIIAVSTLPVLLFFGGLFIFVRNKYYRL